MALPTIIGDLAGTQRQYTWVITAALLATTVSTPIWGKLADLFDKKRLVQVAIVIFVAGSVAAGFAQTVPFLLAMRVVQGLGMGGLTALVQAIMGTIIAPRERGRYAGYMGSVMAVSTVSGPLLGGLLVDTALGWRWCFFVCVPLAVISLFVIQATLKIVRRRPPHPKIDYLGAVLLAGTASLPMLWVTFAGNDFAWWSWQTAAFLGSTVVLLAVTVWWELRTPEPLVPIRLLANRTAILVIVASVVRRHRHLRRHHVPRAVLPAGPRLQPDPRRSAHHPADGRPAAVLDAVRSARQPHRPLQAVPGRRRGRPDRRPGRARQHRPHHARSGSSASAWP